MGSCRAIDAAQGRAFFFALSRDDVVVSPRRGNLFNELLFRSRFIGNAFLPRAEIDWLISDIDSQPADETRRGEIGFLG